MAKLNPQRLYGKIVDPKTGAGEKDFLDFLYRLWARSGGSDGILPIIAGGTASDTVLGAQQNLGLEPGVDVQVYDAGLLSIAGLVTAADRMIYTTAFDTYAVATLTSYGRTLLATTSEANFKATVNLEIGVDVQAYSANLTEAATFFGLTDITGAEAETLTDGSDADALHTHSSIAAGDEFNRRYSLVMV
jgi:hypothetical protein